MADTRGRCGFWRRRGKSIELRLQVAQVLLNRCVLGVCIPMFDLVDALQECAAF